MTFLEVSYSLHRALGGQLKSRASNKRLLFEWLLHNSNKTCTFDQNKKCSMSGRSLSSDSSTTAVKYELLINTKHQHQQSCTRCHHFVQVSVYCLVINKYKLHQCSEARTCWPMFENIARLQSEKFPVQHLVAMLAYLWLNYFSLDDSVLLCFSQCTPIM